jgi:hypothetical protein
MTHCTALIKEKRVIEARFGEVCSNAKQ